MNKRNYEQKPLTKKDFIVVEESLNETLIYDSDKNKLHVLTPVATTVWKSCDGKTSVSEIARKLKAEMDNEFGADVTWLALEELEKNGLLENPMNIPRNGISRRDLIKTAAVSLPLITTMIAPSPARAQSAVQMGGMMMGMMMAATAARTRFDADDQQNIIQQ